MFRLLTSKDSMLIKEAILNKVETLNNEKKEIYLVVPEMFTYSSELQVMDALNLESMINIKIVSFQRITEMVLTRDGGIKRQRIDDVGKALIIRKLMNKNPENFKLYKGMVDKDGFYSKLISLIKDFKNNLVNPDAIQELIKNCSTELLSEKLKEISLMYEGLDMYLKDKYVDNEDRLNQLSEILVESNFFHNKDVIFWQFSGFSQLEYNIFSSIGKMGANVIIGLVLGTDKSNDFEVTIKTKNKIIEIAQENGIDFAEDKIIKKSRLPKYKYIIGSNIENEVNLVAGKIRVLLDENTNFNEMAIVYSMEEYKVQIARIFDEYNIPVLVNSKESLITTAVASWIRSMLSVGIYGFRYEDMIGFLKSCLNIFNSEDVEIFENFILRKNIRGEMYFRDKYFNESNFISFQEEESVNKVRAYIVKGFKKLKNLSKKQLPLMELVEEFFDALKSFEFITMIDKFIDELEEEGLLKEIEIIEQSYSAMVDIIDQMVETLSEEKMDLKEFTALLESGFRQKSIGAIPQGNNQILLSSVEEGLSGEYKWIFFLGANSEHLPRAKKSQGLLSEQELIEIKGKELGLNTRKTIDLEESHNLYKIITMPKDTLVFSYSKIGIDGRKQKPSIYITKYNATTLEINSSWEFRLDPTMYELSNIIRKYVEYEKITKDDINLLSKTKNDKTLQKKMDIILKANSLDKEDFVIDAAKARLIYAQPLELSVTRIHQMTRCEFAHFIKYGISPREREVATIEPKEMGTLLHGFVEDFSQQVKENPNILNNFSENEMLNMVDKLYQEKIDAFLDKESLDSYRNNYLLRKLKRSAVTLAKLMVEQVKASEFNIYGQEVYFGKEKNFPEVDLSDNNFSAWIKGQIDRVDIFEENGKKYIRIIDYKSSGKVFSLSDNYNILDVQLVIYMAAALAGNKDSLPGGAFYLPLIEKQLSLEDNEIDKVEEKRRESYKMDGIAISDEDILKKMDKNFDGKDSGIKLKGRGILEERTNLLSEKEFVGLVDHIKKEVKNHLKNLFSGKVRINPYVKENNDTGCKFCKYRSICGFDEKLDKERLRKLAEYDSASIKKKIGGDN